MTCSDYFQFRGAHYLVTVDRYSNWPIIQQTEGKAAGLIKCLRSTFVTYGIPEELSSDGGPEYTAKETQDFLKALGVQHRLSSVAFPHSNSRAEIAVKTCKRILTDNTATDGSLNMDKFQRAMLQYRNTPDPVTKTSPAVIVFGHTIRDMVPVLPGCYKPNQTWTEVSKNREEALRHRHAKQSERLEEHTRKLPPLKVGDNVFIQNQQGNNLRKWDKSGLVIEV